MSRILHVFRSLPINLTRHFSGPRLCWCCGCRAHPVCSGWCVALRLLHLFFLHRGGCTERVEDDVLVFFPIARLRVRFGFDVALEEWNKNHLAAMTFIVSLTVNVLGRLQTHHKVFVAGVGFCGRVWLTAGAGRAVWRWSRACCEGRLRLSFQQLWPWLAGRESPWLERAPDLRRDSAGEREEVL